MGFPLLHYQHHLPPKLTPLVSCQFDSDQYLAVVAIYARGAILLRTSRYYSNVP